MTFLQLVRGASPGKWPPCILISAMIDRNNQNSSKSICGITKRFEAGSSKEAHSHYRDQLLFAISGVMHVQTESGIWIVPTNRAVFIPSHSVHSVHMHGAVEMRSLLIPVEFESIFSRKLRVIYVNDLLKQLIIAFCKDADQHIYDVRDQAILNLIYLEIGRATDLPIFIPLPQDIRLQRLCAEVLADPASRKTLDEFAETSGASTRTLSRLFGKDIGMSFLCWRQRVRMHHAIDALTQNVPVGIVAQECGYGSTSAFSAAFRKNFEIRPTDLQAGDDTDLFRSLVSSK